jgi:hypothetical protein
MAPRLSAESAFWRVRNTYRTLTQNNANRHDIHQALRMLLNWFRRERIKQTRQVQKEAAITYEHHGMTGLTSLGCLRKPIQSGRWIARFEFCAAD